MHEGIHMYMYMYIYMYTHVIFFVFLLGSLPGGRGTDGFFKHATFKKFPERSKGSKAGQCKLMQFHGRFMMKQLYKRRLLAHQASDFHYHLGCH